MMSRKLSPWLVRSSVLAIGISIIAFGATAPVSSQSFMGNAEVAAGEAYISSTGNSTYIQLNSAQSVIDWTIDNDDPSIFQRANTTATFDSYLSDYAVLNRVYAGGRAVEINGTIRSYANSNIGGSIYFYSPGGIIIGSNALIDVGALGLSTAEPVVNNGSFITINGASRSVLYNPSAQGREVEIRSGAEIYASNDRSSYMAIMAPVIRQQGIIDVNGSTALVAAAAGTL
ncbi:MAG: filamentous hemagglutinin N-terminal domain-containing protein, partial [Sphingobium sp.]